MILAWASPFKFVNAGPASQTGASINQIKQIGLHLWVIFTGEPALTRHWITYISAP